MSHCKSDKMIDCYWRAQYLHCRNGGLGSGMSIADARLLRVLCMMVMHGLWHVHRGPISCMLYVLWCSIRDPACCL
jgi:hypothetical protein